MSRKRVKRSEIVYSCECHKSKRGQIGTVSLMWPALHSDRLPTENISPLTSLNMRLDGFRATYGRSGERKISFLYRESNPDSSVFLPVAWCPYPLCYPVSPYPTVQFTKFQTSTFLDHWVHFRSVYTSPLRLHVKQPLLWTQIGNVALFNILEFPLYTSNNPMRRRPFIMGYSTTLSVAQAIAWNGRMICR